MKIIKWLANLAIITGVMLSMLSIDSYSYGYVEFLEWIRCLFTMWFVPIYIGVLVHLGCWVCEKISFVIDWYQQYQQDMAMLAWYIEREEKHRKFKVMLEMTDLSKGDDKIEA